MVNKPHPPRQGNKANKNPSAAAANGEDTSFIVFSKDDKPGKKPKPSTPTNDGAGAGNKGKVCADGAAAEAEKKPDTRTLIAGASWTGKLPMTLFNEHCQKQRWEKPEYDVRSGAKGFTGSVVLR